MIKSQVANKQHHES